jgi:hypothetical protein
MAVMMMVMVTGYGADDAVVLLWLFIYHLQTSPGAPVDDASQQLEPLADSLQALDKRLNDGSGRGNSKKKKKRSVLRSQTGEEGLRANASGPIMQLA